jgi:2-C-methyl-D-erythritol 4-phosphate cytidylyltransferase
VQFANNHFKLQPQDILVTHDAARINVSRKIIDKNIEIARKYGFASTVLSLHDSIVEVKEQIKYLERSHKYIVQTPQTIQYRF